MTITTPSLSRTVDLPLVLAPFSVLRFPNKDPGDTLDFTLDITAWLAEIADTISSFTATCATVTVPPLTITQLSSSPFGTALTILLGGGLSGYDYPIDFTINTSAGRTLNRVVNIRCVTISSPYPG